MDKNDENLEITSFTQFLKSFESLIVKSLPMIIGMELSIITTIVNMYFIIGKENVIGIGFGTIYANLVIKALLLSFNTSILQLMSSYYKRHSYQKIGLFYQRSLILNGVVLIVITPILAISDKILIFCQVSEIFAHKSIQYVWEMLPALYAFTYFDCTKNYLKAMDIDYPVLLIQSFTSILHIYLSKNMIVYLDLGLRGAAWAKNFSSCASALLIYLYIFKYQSGHPSWIEWDKRSLKSIFYFALNLLQTGAKMFFQSISFEIMAFVAIGLSDDEFSVCVCLIFTAQAIYMFFLGVALTAAQRIKASFKKRDFEQAKRQSSHYLATSVLLGIIMCLLLLIFKHHWIKLFYMDNDTSAILQDMLPLFCATLTIGGCQIMLGSVLSAVGQQVFVTNFQLIAHYVVGILSGILLAYVNDRGIHGLWLGWACGLAVSSICLLTKLALLDWDEAARQLLVEIQERQ